MRLDAYLQRIDYSGDMRPSADVLAALHLADTDQRAEAATAVRRTGGLYRLTSCDRLLAPY